VSGMAWGADLMFAEVALELGIPLVAAVPLPGQSDSWPPESRRRWERCIARAQEVVEVWRLPAYAAKTPVARLMKRNTWMLDNSDTLVVVWDGRRTGGTWRTLEEARARGRRALVIDPRSGAMRVEAGAPPVIYGDPLARGLPGK